MNTHVCFNVVNINMLLALALPIFFNKLKLIWFANFAQIHVLNEKILPASHYKHLISDATLRNYSTVLGGHLLERDVLSAVTKK